MGFTEIVAVHIEAPVVSFRVPYAREYLETYPVPPPSTVFGMLLSYVGEQWRITHAGARLAVALLSEPQRSVVLRTTHRYKKRDITDKSNQRPDYQELLTDVELLVWVAASEPEGRAPWLANESLAARLRRALVDPGSVTRYGGLSLGESTHLVNSVSLVPADKRFRGRLLAPSLEGRWTLPVWPNHVGSRGTRWGRYRLGVETELGEPDEAMFTSIEPTTPPT